MMENGQDPLSLLAETKCSVSSVLNRDVKQYGKQFLFDGDEETCWNSDQGEQQHIALQFPTAVIITSVVIRFQGGFVGKECRAEGRSVASSSMYHMCDFFPEDINAVQRFEITCAEPVDRLRLVFSSSTDFFGRITIYHLGVLGHMVK
ncbi:nuclear receptor 2C2-associated protein-like [Sycon ciliatum]|uniref:nuclear receptor 2C2-associated protein-like n=1 Tax=Sycon ciliatum TaxID=27933 RepID=UPI0031F67A01